MSKNTHSRAAHRGFTLVELLVVIGIIALLISILLPALGRARQSANSVKCMANLKSVGQALFMYANLHKGMLPYGFTEDGAPLPPGGTYRGPTEHWDTLVLFAISSSRSESQYGSGTTAVPGPRGIFICPQVTIDTTVASRVTHYSVHPVLFPNLRDLSNYVYLTQRKQKGMRPYKLADVRRSSEIVGIFDSSIENTTWGAFAVGFGIHKGALYGPTSGTLLIDDFTRSGVTQTLGTPVDMTPSPANGIPNGDFQFNQGNIRFRHNGDTKANVLMMDGHVESFSFNKRKPVTAATDMTLRNLCVPPPKY